MSMVGKRLCAVFLAMAFLCSGCEQGHPDITVSPALEEGEELKGLSLFLQLGPFEEYLRKCVCTLEKPGEETVRVYIYEDDEVDFELRAGLEGEIFYLHCFQKGEEPKTAPVDFEPFQDGIQKIRALYGTEDYLEREDRWEEYCPGDSIAIVEYTRDYDGVFHYEESMAFSIDLVRGALRVYAWRREAPRETRVVLSAGEAVQTAERWRNGGNFKKFAEDNLLRPDALDGRSPDSVELEFHGGVMCYCVFYRLGNAFDPSYFADKVLPVKPFPFALWISASDGTVQDYGYKDGSYRPTAFPTL